MYKEEEASTWQYRVARSKSTDMIYNSSDISAKVNELIEQYKDQKTLIFSLRTEVADTLAVKSYHSKNVDNEALEEFKLSESGHLSTVNMIAEGMTIKNLNTIICHTVTSNTEDFQQKLGRGLQLGEIDNSICTIHLICLRGTAQEYWVELACKSLNQYKIFMIYSRPSPYYDIINISKIEYFKKQFKSKELYLYNGSFCYKHKTNQGEIGYIFINDATNKLYNLPLSKLELL